MKRSELINYLNECSEDCDPFIILVDDNNHVINPKFFRITRIEKSWKDSIIIGFEQ